MVSWTLLAMICSLQSLQVCQARPFPPTGTAAPQRHSPPAWAVLRRCSAGFLGQAVHVKQTEAIASAETAWVHPKLRHWVHACPDTEGP
jgi:hypothetical protein